MFQLKLLDTPESISVPSGTVVLTHECRVLKVDPRMMEEAVKVSVMKGFLDASGTFQDYGEHVVTAMDKTGLDALIANPAAKLADIAPAIEARRVEKQQAETKRLADEAAAKDIADKAAKKAAREAAQPQPTQETP